MLSLILGCTTPTPDTDSPQLQDTQTDAPLTTLYRDADGDGFGDPDWTRGSDVAALDGWTQDATDCNDADATVFPGAAEVSQDGVDQDCDSHDACTEPRRWFDGDVSLFGEDEWAAFCTDYDAVDGDLTLESDALDPWAGCVCEVTGDVSVRDTTGIAGLRGVTHIGGDLLVEHPHDLRSLQSVGDLRLYSERVSLPRLQTVTHDASISGRDGSRVLDVPALRSVGGTLTLRWVGGGLPALERADALWVAEAEVQLPELVDVHGITMAAGTLTVPALESVDALDYTEPHSVVNAPALWKVGRMGVTAPAQGSLPTLTRVGLLGGTHQPPELPALTHLDRLWWQGDGAALWSQLPSLQRIQDATFQGPRTDLSTFPPGVRMDALTLSGTALSGALPDPAVLDGTLQIEHLNGASLFPLSNVETIPVGLRVVHNSQLTTLELDSLQSIGGGLYWTNNPAVPDSELDALLDQVVVQGNVIIE